MDDCDRCHAPALYRYRKGPSEILLCGHHGKQYGPTLRLRHWVMSRMGT